jgi:hypothetical protein
VTVARPVPTTPPKPALPPLHPGITIGGKVCLSVAAALLLAHAVALPAAADPEHRGTGGNPVAAEATARGLRGRSDSPSYLSTGLTRSCRLWRVRQDTGWYAWLIDGRGRSYGMMGPETTGEDAFRAAMGTAPDECR